MRYPFITSLLALCVTGAMFALPAYAKTTVENTFVVESNTGGNVVSGGTVIEGTERSSVSITTVIDGEVVEDIHETSSGEPVLIERTHAASTTDAHTYSRVRLNTIQEERVAPIISQALFATSSTSTITNTRELLAAVSEVAGQRHPLLTYTLGLFSRTLAYALFNLFDHAL